MPSAHAFLILAIFVLTYGAFMRYPKYRGHLAMAGAALVVLCGAMSVGQAFHEVKWVVMAIFFGVLILAHFFQWSKAPDFVAEHIINTAHNARWALLLICIITGFLSIFIENVAAVLIVAPVAFAICDRLKVSPVPVLVGIAVSSNLQGAATLIGDPPSMLLAGHAGMDFNDFFIYEGRPSMFFVTQAGAIVSFAVLWWVFRHDKGKIERAATDTVRSWTPAVLLCLLVASLAAASFLGMHEAEPSAGAKVTFGADLDPINGWICVGFALLGFLWFKLVEKEPLLPLIKELDWASGFFLIGCFVIIAALQRAGLIDYVARFIEYLGRGNVFIIFSLFVWLSVLFSAFIDNVPYIIAMLPVAQKLADNHGVPPALFLFGLLIGASLGGNLTPIGASANVVAFGILRKKGYRVRLRDFLKVGAPFTAAAVGAGYLFIWVVWSP